MKIITLNDDLNVEEQQQKFKENLIEIGKFELKPDGLLKHR